MTTAPPVKIVNCEQARSANDEHLQAGGAVLHGVAVGDGKMLLKPGVERGHVADLGIIVEDDAGLLFGQHGVILFKPGVTVGAGDDRCLRNGQGAVRHQKAEAVLLADRLQHRLACIGGQRLIQALLHVGSLFIGPCPGGGAGGDALHRHLPHSPAAPAGLLHKPEAGQRGGKQHTEQKQLRLPAAVRRGGAFQRECGGTAEGGPEQVHKGRAERNEGRAQDKKVGRHAGQPAQPEQQAAQCAVLHFPAVAAERPAAGQRSRQIEVAEIQTDRDQAVRRTPERQEKGEIPEQPLQQAGGRGAAAPPGEHPRKDGRRCGQRRDPAGLQNGGSLPSQSALMAAPVEVCV